MTDEPQADTAVLAYKNSNTDEVVARTAPDPRLDALPEWERCDPTLIGYSTADYHDRALAERRSIEAAAAIRLDTAAGAAIAGVAAATAYNTGGAAGDGHVTEPLPTLSTGSAGEQQQPIALLDKGHELRDTGATRFEENKKLAEQEIAHPPKTGVLQRAKADHKTGRTEIAANRGKSRKETTAAAEKAIEAANQGKTVDTPSS